MTLKTCPSCKKEISKKALSCQYCGKPIKNKWKFRGLEIIGLLGVLMGIGGMFISIGMGFGLAAIGFIMFIIGRFRS